MKIGSYEFEPGQHAVKIMRQVVYARVRKVIRVDAVLAHHHTLAEARADVEALEGQLALLDRGDAALELVPGRYYDAARRDYSRHLNEDTFTTAVHLELLTADAFERGTVLQSANLTISDSGDGIPVSQAGNTVSRPRLTLSATGVLVGPSLSDGANRIRYEGTLAAGDVLVIDAEPQSAVLNGAANALPAMTGDFPLLGPGATTITYEDEAASTHQAHLLVEYRDTWD